jgi:hypothetical protein
MPLFPRLILCLFALALLPAAPVHARMAVATAAPLQEGVPIAAASSAVPCHEAPAMATVATAMDHGEAEAAGTGSAQADCCGDMTGAGGDCDGTCACPSAIPALAAPVAHAASALPASRDDTPVPAGRAGPNHTPPQRPPTG